MTLGGGVVLLRLSSGILSSFAASRGKFRGLQYFSYAVSSPGFLVARTKHILCQLSEQFMYSEGSRVSKIRTSLVRLSSNSLKEDEVSRRVVAVAKTRTNRFKCSINTCKLTSSVKMACPLLGPGPEPYMLVDMCVVEGFSFERRKRA